MFREELIGKYLSCGVAYSTDSKTRKEATSGGLVSSLLVILLRRGLIDGVLVVRNDGLKQMGVLARTEDEIMAAAGSKYLQIPLNAFLGEIIKENGKFAVVGLPCHLRGLRKLEALNPNLKSKIVLKIGLFCSHAVTYNGMTFLLDTLGVKLEEVTDLRYRAKMQDTTGLYVRTLNGKDLFIPSRKYWGKFFNFFFIPEGCMNCEDLTAEESDISVGDAWGFEETERLGLSMFITRSEAGEKALNITVSEGLAEVRSVNPEVVVRSQRYIKVKKRKRMQPPKKLLGHTYHTMQIIGNFISKNEICHPILRMWLKFLLQD
jgi:coenzyme F420 hydrogenase subunit beta